MMDAKALLTKLQKCNPAAKLRIIAEEELECCPEWWNDEKGEVSGLATKLLSEDVHSHEIYLLAIEKRRRFVKGD